MAAVNFTIPNSRSVYFDGIGDYLTLPITSGLFVFGTGDFTIETWVYPTVLGGFKAIAGSEYSTRGATLYLLDTTVTLYTSGSVGQTPPGSIALNTWQHIAAVRNNGVLKIYINGVERSSVPLTNNLTRLEGVIGSQPITLGTELFIGYMSNLRVVRDTAIYISNFTPSTEPLASIADTSLLTCQSPNIINNAYNQVPITVFGNTRVDNENPFGFTISPPVSANLFDDISTTNSVINQLTPLAKSVFDIYDIQSSIDAPVNAVGTNELTTQVLLNQISSNKSSINISDIQSSIDIPQDAVGTNELTIPMIFSSQSILQFNINGRNNFSDIKPITSSNEAVGVSRFLKTQIVERTSPQRINPLRTLVRNTQTAVSYSYWI